LKVRWVKRIDLKRGEDPRGVFEQGEYLYVYYKRRIEKRSKVNGELLDEWTTNEIFKILDECTAGAGKIYCVSIRSLEDKTSFFVFSHDLELEKVEEVRGGPEYYTQALYHGGYIYALGSVKEDLYVIEKRSSTDFSLISDYEIRSRTFPRMSFNPYTEDLWVLWTRPITKEEVEGVIDILDADLARKKRTTLKYIDTFKYFGFEDILLSFILGFNVYGFKGIDFDEKGYAYLLAAGFLVFRYDRNGNLVSSVDVWKHCNILLPEEIVYLKDRVYVAGRDYPEGRKEVVLCVFSRDLKFLERITIAEYYKDEVEYASIGRLGEPKYFVSDGERLYIGVEVGEKGGGRRFDLYSVSPLVEVLSVEEPGRAEVPVLRVDFTSIGIGDIVALLKQPVSGLVSGYSCADSMRFKTELTKVTAPKGFEGEWTCCLLGCGGWGCAYLCTRGEGEVVFKVPRGFEAIIEGRREPPTVHPRDLEKIKTDAEIISKLEHPNIIKLLGYSERAPILVYEFADYGSLYWQLSRGWKPSLKDVL